MPTPTSAAEISADQIRAQRDRILQSEIFIRAKRQCDFFAYVIDATLDGRSDALKEVTLGLEVFKRDDSFDPRIDSIVRVEANRLRGRLREYYQEEGSDDPVRIDIPKGHYVPVFRLRRAHIEKKQTRPAGQFPGGRIGIVLFGIAAIAFVSLATFSFGWFTGPAEEFGDPLRNTALTTDIQSSIAVLPFRNLSSVEEDRYFVDGMHDDILTQLTKLSFLDKVISRTSVQQYRDTTKTVVVIGEELGVATILEGSVQRAGDRVRVNAQLINAVADKHIWSETYDLELTTASIFAIQSEIATSIAAALQVTLSVAEQQALTDIPTDNLQAYELYQQAQYVRRTFGLGSRPDVAELLERAVTLDPNFALAHVGLARAYVDRYFSSERNVLHRDLAQTAVFRAIQLKPDMPEVHIALADFYYKAYLDYERAIEELSIAIPLAPGNAEARAIRAFVLRRRGDIEESIPDLLRAIELDPGNFSPHYVLADTYVILGEFERSILHYDRALELAPKNFGLKILRTYAITSSDINSTAMRDLIADPAFSDGTSAVEVLYRWEIALNVRDYDLAMGVIQSHQSESVIRQTAFYPLDLMRGITEFFLVDRGSGADYFESALETLVAQLEETPDDPRIHSAIGMAYAGLGIRNLAIEAAEMASKIYPVSGDAVDGPLYILNYAKTAAMLGDNDTAIEKLEELLSQPRNWYATENAILLHPMFDQLQEDARFTALLKKE